MESLSDSIKQCSGRKIGMSVIGKSLVPLASFVLLTTEHTEMFLMEVLPVIWRMKE